MLIDGEADINWDDEEDIRQGMTLIALVGIQVGVEIFVMHKNLLISD